MVEEVNIETYAEHDEWGNFVNGAFDEEGNYKHSFKNRTKKFGRPFIDFVRCMWAANDGIMSEEEFVEHHGIPQKFFDKKVKGFFE